MTTLLLQEAVGSTSGQEDEVRGLIEEIDRQMEGEVVVLEGEDMQEEEGGGASVAEVNDASSWPASPPIVMHLLEADNGNWVAVPSNETIDGVEEAPQEWVIIPIINHNEEETIGDNLNEEEREEQMEE